MLFFFCNFGNLLLSRLPILDPKFQKKDGKHFYHLPQNAEFFQVSSLGKFGFDINSHAIIIIEIVIILEIIMEIAIICSLRIPAYSP